MFAKCANPQCSTGFEYHLGGQFYRFPQGDSVGPRERNTHSIVHFWLCPQCARLYALEYDGVHCLLIRSLAYHARDWDARADTALHLVAQTEQQSRVALLGAKRGGRP